ncbi:MAG: hypothetical protein LBV28_03820 [Puniceicoccales bacterium]|jgi:ComF family protein|nr:hypothetical protein [Puniceicoccales bacterium]
MSCEKAFPTFSRAASRLLDLFFPRDCQLTGEPVDNAPWRYLSAAGLDALPRITGPYCETCGHPFYGLLAGPQRCPHCQELDPVFHRGKAAVLAKKAGRHLVHILKYRQGTWLVDDMARIMMTTPGFPAFLDGAVLVPVPLHRKRQHHRGYSQTHFLAAALARLQPTLRVASMLERVRATPTQTRLNREQRERNVQDAFALRRGVTVDGTARYVVLDDVFTTGATLNACCEVLVDAGAEWVDVAMFAHG